MKFTSKALAIAALVASANAHMMLNTPVPYGKSTLNNSPLDNSGSDFPCKQRDGVYDITEMNNIAVETPQTLSFLGSAVHGGGSCQVSVTLDQKPTKNSQWKVVHSIIGGCPSSQPGNLADDPNGHGASNFTFSLPKGMPNGQYTLAWTWFNKIGNREIYMNCAPITVTGGGNDNSVLEKLPDMFVANLPREQCETPDSMNIVFPSPGDSVETAESTALATSVVGSGCAAQTKLGAGAGTLGSAGGASATGGASSAAASAPAVTSAVATSNSGGVFAPGASSAASSPAALVSSAAGAAPTSFTTLVITTTAAGVAAPSSVAAPVGGTGVGTAPAAASSCVPCTSNGAVVCIGTTQFGMCNFGCAIPQALAAGTTCSNGTISKRKVIRRIRPHAVAHRRHGSQQI